MNIEDINFSKEEVNLIITSLKKEKEEQDLKFNRIFAKLDRYSKENNTTSIMTMAVLKSNSNIDNKTESKDRKSDEINTDLFSKDATFTDKLLIVLKYYIKRASRFTDIKDTFNKLTDNKKDIRTGLYELRDNNQVVSIKFNDSNYLIYYGLAEWVVETEKGQEFKAPFGPDPSHFQNGILKGEVLIKPKPNIFPLI